MKMTDGELLRRYARQRSETAFAELVRRHIGLVYNAAARQTNNDPHLAEDVTQAVFTDLARKAAKLSRHPALTAWLYTSARFIASNMRRAEQRRVTREKQAHAMNAIHPTPEPEPDWEQICPLLDDAMHTLNEEDRLAVLLRHFEQHSYAEIGARFGVTEDSARMRVNRALEKLHDTLTKRGVTSTAVALVALLAENAHCAVPTYLADKTTRAAIAGTAGATGLGTFLVTKTMMIIVAAALLLMIEIAHFTSRPTAKNNFAFDKKITAIAAEVLNPGKSAVASLAKTKTRDAVLHLQIVTADTGQPIPDVLIDCFDWASENGARKLRANRLGICDVHYSPFTERLELITGKGPFADVRLLWQPRLGDVIPSNYVLRVERAIPISGIVLDPDGAPLPGADVKFILAATDDAEAKSPTKYEYYGVSFEATTDNAGHWQIDRISNEIIQYLLGKASDINYFDADSVLTVRDHLAETQLRQGNYVFKLKRKVKAEGIVVDVAGNPIAGATVTTGYNHDVTLGDGKFSIADCVPTMQRLFANAPGFASARVDVDLGEVTNSIRFVLTPGKVLRIRVVDDKGNPVANATINSTPLPRAVAGQPTFGQELYPSSKQTDDEGRANWENAPDSEFGFFVIAAGYRPAMDDELFRPDGQEHVITLMPRAHISPSSPGGNQELRARQ
ncbi:MAG TPA: sigma-70 family RNA polymerase sigma factor [Verrucomicrobiae bacterium]|jgi:RNA polymerase sigma factor (sigma-70 family)